MKKFIFSALVLFITTCAFSQGKARTSTGSSSTRTTNSSGVSRPHYTGSTHTESHGGTYTGPSSGSSHKGDHYTAPNGYKGYGTHKSK